MLAGPASRVVPALFFEILNISDMNIEDLINSGLDVTVSVKKSDLIELAEYLIRKIEREKEEKYLTADETCKMLGISKSTLFRLEERGILYCKRLGRRRMYPKHEVESFMQENEYEKNNKSITI